MSVEKAAAVLGIQVRIRALFVRLDPDPQDPESRGFKMTHKSEESSSFYVSCKFFPLFSQQHPGS
jgi:hypothetical protein